MFYISPWMLYGVILSTAYFVLVLFGFGGKRQAKVSKPRNDLTSAENGVHIEEENQVNSADNDPDDAKQEKDSDQGHYQAQTEIREGTTLYQIPNAYKSVDDLDFSPANSEEKLDVELATAAGKSEEVVQSQRECLQELAGSGDFTTGGEGETNRVTIEPVHVQANNFSESETILTFMQSESLQTSPEESEFFEQKISSNENVESQRNHAEDTEDEQPVNASRELDSHALESDSTTLQNKRKTFVGSFAEGLVAKARSEAFHDIGVESAAIKFADRISAQIVFDAIGQFADTSPQNYQNVQELQKLAGDVVSSLINDASGNVSAVKDVECFAGDLSDQVIHEGVEKYVTKAKVEEVRKERASLSEVKIFSECIVSEVVSDGIDEAAEQKSGVKDVAVNKEEEEKEEEEQNDSHLEHDPTHDDCEVANRIPFVSTSLQPHIGGVVENLVNGAICEAVSRIKTHSEQEAKHADTFHGCAHESLESQVNNTVQELIVSALNEAAGESLGQKTEHQTVTLETSETKCEENVLDTAIILTSKDAVRKEQEKQVLNGHVDHTEEPVVENILNECQTTPEIFIRSENEEGTSDGFDIVPDRDLSSSTTETKVELREQKSSEGGDYWRRSLILDLEDDDDELDESFGSERSPTSTEDSVSTPTAKDEECVLDDESEEFVDSSEDEVIDHAEEAKLGAVGGAPVEKYHSDDEEMDLDDGDDDDDDDEMFVPQSMVDGLCASKPKQKSKKKHKSRKSPRPRVQSAGSHFNNAVVIDNGCGCIKLGLAGDKMPRVVQPSVFGVPKRYSLQMAGMDNRKDRKYGDTATMKAGVMQLEYPMSAGLVENWSDVEEIWEYMLTEEMSIEEASHPVLITEVANNSRRNREKIAEILFEHLSVPAMYLANELVLSLYASGLTMGMCVSSGFSVTQAAAVYEGYLLAHTVQQLDIGGQALTNNLQKLLRDSKGLNFNSSSGWQIVDNMKEKMAYVAADYSAEMKQYKTNASLTQFYRLPDGQTVDLNSEMISTPEPLFAPDTLLGVDDTVASQFPIQKLANNAFKRCSPELQETVARNVVLSGGTTLLRGLAPRLQQELSKINPKIRSLRTPENRMYSAWIGGSILSSLSSFDGMYVTVDEYADHGARVVNQKCF